MLALRALSPNVSGQSLEAAWSWSSERKLEWGHVVVGDDPSALLVCDSGGAIELLNLITGRSRLVAPIDARSGTRYAGAQGGIAYCFDRHRVYAISITDTDERDLPRDRLLWRVGEGANLLEQRRGDPEFLTSAVAAAPTPNGLLVVRSDGMAGELDRADGSVRWVLPLPTGADAMVRVDGFLAAVVFRQKSAAYVAFLDLKEPTPNPAIRKLGETWPIWCEWTSDGLLAAWPNRFVLGSRDADAQPFPVRARAPFAAAGIELFRPQRLARAAGAEPIPPQNILVTVGSDGAATAHYTLTGKLAWRGETRATQTRWRQVDVSGRIVLLGNENGRVAAFDAVDGDLLGFCIGADAQRGLGIGATDRHAYSLRIGRLAERGQPPARVTGDRLALSRTPLFRPGAWSADRARAGEETFDLGPPTVPRDVIWPPGRMILIESRQIRTYVLPE